MVADGRRAVGVDIIVGYQVAFLPMPWVPSSQRPCRDCAAPVWVSNALLAAMPNTLETLCVGCALRVLKPEQIEMHPAVAEEVGAVLAEAQAEARAEFARMQADLERRGH